MKKVLVALCLLSTFTPKSHALFDFPVHLQEEKVFIITKMPSHKYVFQTCFVFGAEFRECQLLGAREDGYSKEQVAWALNDLPWTYWNTAKVLKWMAECISRIEEYEQMGGSQIESFARDVHYALQYIDKYYPKK